MMDNVNAEGMDAIFAALQHLKFGKHEVIVFDVADKKHEIDFDYDNRPYEFIDLETGEKVKLHANEIKNHYTTEIKKLKQQLRLKCLQYKIDLIETDINKGIEEILMPYLMKRQRML
jgi:hypothetical protein